MAAYDKEAILRAYQEAGSLSTVCIMLVRRRLTKQKGRHFQH